MPETVEGAVPDLRKDQAMDPVPSTATVPRARQCRCQACRQHRNPAHDAAFALDYQPPFAHVSRLEGSYFAPSQPRVGGQQENHAACWVALFK